MIEPEAVTCQEVVQLPASSGAAGCDVRGQAHTGRGHRAYLPAVQVQTLPSDLQLQDLNLVVPLLLNRGIPDVPFVQAGFNPT